MIQDFKKPEKGDTLEQVLDNWALTNEQAVNGTDYMNQYFTKKEATRHADNLYHFFSKKEDVAMLKVMLISLGVNLNQVL